MNTHDRRRLRALAIATLVALSGAVLGLLLTIAFPTFGMPQPFSGFFYIPPQAYLVGLLVPAALVLALATSISGLRQSRRARQPGWTGAFTVVFLLLLLGPAYLICSLVGWSVFPHPPTIPTPQYTNAWLLVAGGFVAMLVLTPICALAYSLRVISPSGPIQGQG